MRRREKSKEQSDNGENCRCRNSDNKQGLKMSDTREHSRGLDLAAVVVALILEILHLVIEQL